MEKPFIIDSNFFIQAYRINYPFDVVPSFWVKVKELAEKHGISMPIVNATYGIIYEGKSIKEALASLMGRELKEEFGK